MGLNLGGIASGALSGIPVVGGVLSGVADAIGGLFGGRSGSELKAAENAAAYKAAMAGNRAGFEFLAGKSGAILPITLSNSVKLNSTKPWAAGATLRAPWDDPGAKADALNKYNQIIAAAAAGSGGAAAALGPVSPLTPAGKAADAVVSTLGTPLIAGLPTWAVLGIAGAVGYTLLKRR